MKKLFIAVIFLVSAINSFAWEEVVIDIATNKFDDISVKMSTVLEDICSHSAQKMDFSWDKKNWVLTEGTGIGTSYRGILSKKQMGSYVDDTKLNTYRNDLNPFKVGQDFDITAR